MNGKYITMSCPNCDSGCYDMDDVDVDISDWTVSGYCRCNDCGTSWEFTAPLCISDDDIDDASIEYDDDEHAERMREWYESR